MEDADYSIIVTTGSDSTANGAIRYAYNNAIQTTPTVVFI